MNVEKIISNNGNGSETVDTPSNLSTSGFLYQPTSEAVDYFSTENLKKQRLEQDYDGAGLGEDVLIRVEVRKPEKTWWWRAHPALVYPTRLLEWKVEGKKTEMYWVAGDLWGALEEEPAIVYRRLTGCINRQGKFFLYPVRTAGTDGKVDGWCQTALEAVHLAESTWVRLMAGSNEYVVRRRDGLDDPSWPKQTMAELLKLAFQNNIITDLSHPVIEKLFKAAK